MSKAYITGYVSVSETSIPKITDHISFIDFLGAVRVRLGIRRGFYRVSPGLYAIGLPYMGGILNLYMHKGMTVRAILWSGMIPYLPGDALKILVAAGVCPVLGRRLQLAAAPHKQEE